MKTFIALAVASLGASVSAQTNNFLFDLRIVPIGEQLAPGGALNLPASGGVLSFWLQGRSTAISLAPGQRNFGVGRASNGPAGQTPAFITVTDQETNTRLSRGSIGITGTGANAGTPLTGRGPLFRTSGTSGGTVSPWHSATENGSGGSMFPSGAGNAMGAFDQNGDRLYGFDCYAGGVLAGEENPYTARGFVEVPIGQASAWYNLYRFDVAVTTNQPRQIVINAAAYMSAFVGFIDLGDSWTGNLSGLATGSRSVTASPFVITPPTPGAAAMVGLGALVAMRRRR